MLGSDGFIYRAVPYLLVFPHEMPRMPSPGDLPDVPPVQDQYDIPEAPKPPKPPEPPKTPVKKRNYLMRGNYMMLMGKSHKARGVKYKECFRRTRILVKSLSTVASWSQQFSLPIEVKFRT